MAKLPYLQDEAFLLKIDNLRLRHQYARITVLDFHTEKKIEDITGRITSGNISCNGDSAVRRTANLTFVIDDPQSQNLLKVSNLLSINKKIKLEVGLENTTEQYSEYPIIWFPQGTYVITQPSISYSTSGLTVSLQLKDKMCLLNGDCGGVFPAQTTLSEIEDIDISGKVMITYPTIYQIIQEVVNHWGGEQLGKIIINDLGERTYQIMKSNSSNPFYVSKVSVEAESDSYVFSTDKEKAGVDAIQFNFGEPVCYSPTEFIYPGELVVAAGSSVTAALDTIKNTLGGNFEYFYDIDGNFIFQEIKNYINTSQATILNNLKNIDNTGEAMNNAYKMIRHKGKSVYDFKESPLIISYSTTPNYLNIKNDFLVWGVRTSGKSNKKYPIRYHLAIDERPEPQIFEHVYVYLSNTDDDTNIIRAQVPFKLEGIYDITNYGIGTPGIVYWITISKEDYDKQIDAIEEACLKDLEDLDAECSVAKNNSEDKSEEALKKIEAEYEKLKKERRAAADRDIQILNQANEKVDGETTYNRYYIWSEDLVDYVDVTSVGHRCDNYKATDWRTVLYLQGTLSEPYGTDSNYYYIELKNEWPKLYDLRPRKSDGTEYNKNDSLYCGKSGTGQSFWQHLIEDPTQMDYYLDFIDTNAAISEFSVNNIGRRQKVLQDDDINCIFEPSKFCNTVAIRIPKETDTTLITKKYEKDIEQCKLDGRGYSKIEAGIYDAMIMKNSYFSAYEAIRTNLQEYTDYNESLQISCVPIFHLEPNTRIFVQNRNLNINGEYLIKSISIPLGNGTMSINANKVIEKL